jgi:hypothetical protein
VEPPLAADRAPRAAAAAPAAGRRSWAAARPDRLARFSLWAPSPRLEARHELRGLVSHARHAAQNFDGAANMLFFEQEEGRGGPLSAE